MPNATGYADSPHPLPSRARMELEMGIGVEPIEALQAKRHALVQQIAPLRARYGPSGTWDARRKVIRQAKQNEVVLMLTQQRGKAPSEAEGERLANGTPQALAALDEVEREMARYYLLEDQIKQIDELLLRDHALIRYSASEPRV